MRERYLVVKQRSVARNPFAPDPSVARGFAFSPMNAAGLGAGGVPAFVPNAEPLEFEEIELSDSEVSQILNQNDTRAIAPHMPMSLIKPMDTQAIPVPAAGSVAWGIKAVKADTSPYNGTGVTVAVLDTGINNTHPAFHNVGMQLVEEDFTGTGIGDTHGHGTHCAGTIFGRDVNGVRIGVARGVSKALIYKVLGPNGGDSLAIYTAINRAVDEGAHVISMSLGIDFPGYVKRMENLGMPTEMAVSRALHSYRLNVALFESVALSLESRSAMRAAGPCVLIAAAGNESMRHINPQFKIAVAPPAVARGFVSVAALGESQNGFRVADFSNTGVNVAAPGVNILSADLGTGFQQMSGTSMATPHVAGVAALHAEYLMKKGMFNNQMFGGVLSYAATLNGITPGFDPFDIGRGIVQAPQ